MARRLQSDDRQPATVFYDGACPVCSREVDLYRKLDQSCAIRWHDVSADAGDLEKECVTQADALERLHVRLPDGRLRTGVQAIIAIWECLPGFRFVVPVTRWVPVRWALERGYDWYAPRRTWLTGHLTHRRT